MFLPCHYSEIWNIQEHNWIKFLLLIYLFLYKKYYVSDSIECFTQKLNCLSEVRLFFSIIGIIHFTSNFSMSLLITGRNLICQYEKSWWFLPDLKSWSHDLISRKEESIQARMWHWRCMLSVRIFGWSVLRFKTTYGFTFISILDTPKWFTAVIGNWVHCIMKFFLWGGSIVIITLSKNSKSNICRFSVNEELR